MKCKFGLYVKVPARSTTRAPCAAPVTRRYVSEALSTSVATSAPRSTVRSSIAANWFCATGASSTAVTSNSTVETFESSDPSFAV